MDVNALTAAIAAKFQAEMMAEHPSADRVAHEMDALAAASVSLIRSQAKGNTSKLAGILIELASLCKPQRPECQGSFERGQITGCLTGLAIALVQSAQRKQPASIDELLEREAAIAILMALEDGELANNRIAAEAGLAEETVARRMAELRASQIVESRKSGTRTLNRLTVAGRAALHRHLTAKAGAGVDQLRAASFALRTIKVPVSSERKQNVLDPHVLDTARHEIRIAPPPSGFPRAHPGLRFSAVRKLRTVQTAQPPFNNPSAFKQTGT